jgi:outer membrane protein TolC
MGSNLAVIEADNAFKTAQTNYFTALYEALLAKVDYEKALGILLDTTKQ